MTATLLRGLVSRAQAAAWLARCDAAPGGSVPLQRVLDLRELCAVLLVPRGALLVASQCWVRRAEPPHHWHQDGALRHDFRPPLGAPLPLQTLWLALTPCGVHAPGLEWADEPLAELLPPAELTPEAVQARFTRFVQPVFEPGDAVRFGGGLLHRTHVPPGPLAPRTSLELRWLPPGPPPPRLAGETLLTVR